MCNEFAVGFRLETVFWKYFIHLWNRRARASSMIIGLFLSGFSVIFSRLCKYYAWTVNNSMDNTSLYADQVALETQLSRWTIGEKIGEAKKMFRVYHVYTGSSIIYYCIICH